MTDADAGHGDLLEVTCPRCGGHTQERYYGPCSTCREQLRATQQHEEQELKTERFEPVMHVTPNAVALKED